MPDPSRWHLLTPQDVEILQPPPVEDGAWACRHGTTSCSAHQRLRILDGAPHSLDALGADVRPWFPLPTRSSETDPR